MALDFFLHREALTWSGEAGAGLGCAVRGNCQEHRCREPLTLELGRPLHGDSGSPPEQMELENEQATWPRSYTKSTGQPHRGFCHLESAPEVEVVRGGIRYREEVDCIIFIV